MNQDKPTESMPTRRRRVRDLRAVPDDGFLSVEIGRLLEGRLHDPFRLLGRHELVDDMVVVRAWLPQAERVDLVEAAESMTPLGDTGVFEWRGPASQVPRRYQFRTWRTGRPVQRAYDPYCFPPLISDDDLIAFSDGRHDRIHRFLGAHPGVVDGISGVRFAVWAPNAERVSVVGAFNDWDARIHPMRVRGISGVWELFVPGIGAGEPYRYELRNRESGELLVKSDPCARATQVRPSTASIVADHNDYHWHDAEWLETRATRDWLKSPVSVYELHLGSWRRPVDDGAPAYQDLAFEIAEYVSQLGFTHVELMPLTEFPLDEPWGYQPTGYFSPTSRYGSADDLRMLIDQLHHHGIGVILDWVPGHFPRDPHGLARFDGTALYEYDDRRKAEHPDWGTLVFNYARNEVRSFLLSSALYWIEEFHVDGLRVDAVASMLYLDYSRQEGTWAPNIYGGRENLEAVSFLKALNEATHREFPGTVTIAEESTAWPGVTTPTHSGGLGFTMKWNMGWMHDTLAYFAEDPIHRKYHHDRLTFGPMYAFSENFVLPLSHDEVVHGKSSLLGRMPGDDWQRFANLRLLYAFQWTYPGKKHLFMGQELGQASEWDHRAELPWHLVDEPLNGGIGRLIADLNRLYRSRPALHANDCESAGFRWLSWQDRDNSVLVYMRGTGESQIVVALNFTPVPREAYRIGVPADGACVEILNTDSRFYGGSDMGNPLPARAEPIPVMDFQRSVAVTLPPLAGVVFEYRRL